MIDPDARLAAGGYLPGSRARPRRLTPTEERVVARAAEGRSNAEIASELGLAVKTVEGHLTRVYRKLGIGSRAALAARPLGLPGPRNGSVGPLRAAQPDGRLDEVPRDGSRTQEGEGRR
jgi:DNA-binding CsgD family transcriptional regulator